MLTATYIIAIFLIVAGIVGFMSIWPQPDAKAIRFVVSLSILTPLLIAAVTAVAVVQGNLYLSDAAGGAAASSRSETMFLFSKWTLLWGVRAIRIPIMLGLLVSSGINLVALLSAQQKAKIIPGLSVEGTTVGVGFCVAELIFGIAVLFQEKMTWGLHDAFDSSHGTVPEALADAYRGLFPEFHLAFIVVFVLIAAMFVIRIKRSSGYVLSGRGLAGSAAFFAVCAVVFILTRAVASDTRRHLPRLFRGEETQNRVVTDIDSAVFGPVEQRCRYKYADLPDPRIDLPVSPVKSNLSICESPVIEVNLNVTLTADVLEVNSRRVTALTKGQFRENDLDETGLLPGLRGVLRQYTSASPIKKILLQADRGGSFETVSSVIRTAATAGFDRFYLITKQPRQMYLSRVDLDHIPVQAVHLSASPPPINPRAGAVSIHIGKDAAALIVEGPPSAPTRETFVIPHIDKIPDTDAMDSRIRAFKKRYPRTDRARVTADATIHYGDIVMVAGMLRECFFAIIEL